jgi:hypothetical protein
MDAPTDTERYWDGEPTTTDYEFARIRLAAAIYCHDELRNEMKRRKRRQKRRRRATVKFEAAIRGLPATAPKEEIINWIGGHPTMGWHIRMEEEDGPIILTAKDILEAPHGSAPCRIAATLLQYFVNRPEQFFDKLLDRQVNSQPEYSVDH